MYRLLLIFVFSYSYALFSQNSIEGKVIETTKTAIPFCPIGLYNVNDSILYKGSISNENGDFTLENIPNGNYFIRVKIENYDIYQSELLNIDSKQDKKMLTISLNPISTNLSEIKISTFKKTISFEEGKVILNVENDILASGNYVLELLRKIPGVIVDAQNNISINGKSGVQFLIDGRLQQIPTSQLLTILSNMSAESISTIELIKNPPAKYDASGTGGLINIVTKKAKLKGLNGTLSNSLSHGKGIGEMSNLIINYKNNKWSIFSNLMGSYRNYISTIQANRDYFIPNNSTSFYQLGKEVLYVSTLNLKMGIQYEYSRKSLLGFNYDNGVVNINSIGNSTTSIFDGNTPDELYVTKNNKEFYQTPSYNLNYSYNLDTLGSQILLSIDYMRFIDQRNIKNDNYSTDKNNPFYSFKNKNDLNFNVLSQKIDLVKFIDENLKIEVGGKISSTSNNTNSSILGLNEINSTYQELGQFSNQIFYNEKIFAGYVNSTKNYKKMRLSAGLRLEETEINTSNNLKGFQYKRSYFNVFPSGSITYKKDENNGYHLAYSYRIERPEYEQLSPFYTFNNTYNYSIGNPFIKPQYSHNLDLEINTGGFLTNSFSFISLNDAVYSYSFMRNSTGVSIDTVVNFKLKQLFSYNLFIQKQFSAFYKVQLNGNVAWMYYSGQIENSSINSSVFAAKCTINNEILLPKEFKIQVFISYNSPYKDGYQCYGQLSSINLAIQKRFFKNKLNAVVGITDIFYSDYNSLTTDLPDQHYYSIQKNDTRRIRLNLTYKFGNMKIENKIQDNKSEVNLRLKKK